MVRTVLSNAVHPEYGSIPLEFPIPDDQYDHTIAQLEKLEIGAVQNSDCKIDTLSSWYTVLEPLIGQVINMDELDYLAKRLESFDDYEASQFQAMASKLELSDIQDFINLTFSSQQATVLTDFSNLEQAGRYHAFTIHGSCMSTEEYQQINGKAEALKLIQSGSGSVTPYGVVYDNGMKLEPLYDGQHFPPYLYQPCQLAIEIRPADGSAGSSDYLYFPAPDQQLTRTLERAGATDAADNRMQIVEDELPKAVSERINLQQESLVEVNEMCEAIAKLSPPECHKLNAAVLMAQPRYASEVRQLAENLEQFEFVPDVKTPEEYGKYMIQHLQNLNFYMPMTVNAERVDEWGDYINDEPERLTDLESIDYADIIRDAILKERMPEEAERGLMIYCDEDNSISAKVQSLRFDVDVRQGKLWGVAECELREPLNASEMSSLIDTIVGQAADGFGEGFEQRELKTPDNDMIYASLWSSDKTWTIQTEQERFSPSELPEVCLSTLPSTGEIICIKRGESGYYPSEWETGNAEKNREIVDYHNQRRGITPAQEEAMVGGSMFGWNTPAADPSRYEKLENSAPSMSL